MPWFHRDTPEEKQQKDTADAARRLAAELEEKSRQAILAGGLPLRAQERVAGIRQALSTGAGIPFYGSDLSVNELLLAQQTGYEPVGMVAGSCVFHIGWNQWTYTGELDAQTEAMHKAGTLAVERLRQEALGMGALGVIGVKLEIRRPGWGEKLIEVVALGTAIRAHGSGAVPEPFVSGLSVQEYISLLKYGSRPVGFAFGNSTYYIYTDRRVARQNRSWNNQEIVQYSQSMNDVQRLAFGRMHTHAESVRAQGIIGVHFHHTLDKIPYENSEGDVDEARADYVIEYVTWGTAIIEAPAHVQMPRPTMLLNLDDLARTARVTAGSMQGER